MDDSQNKKLLAFTQELKKMDLYPGQFEAVIKAYQHLEVSENNQTSSKNQGNDSWEIDQMIGSSLIILSLILFTFYLMSLLPNNKLLIGSIASLIVGIIFLFGKNLVKILLVKLRS
ncbi:MAG: hypothetical protein AB7S65_06865 [Sulfuricurvum sp.]